MQMTAICPRANLKIAFADALRLEMLMDGSPENKEKL